MHDSDFAYQRVLVDRSYTSSNINYQQYLQLRDRPTLSIMLVHNRNHIDTFVDEVAEMFEFLSEGIESTFSLDEIESFISSSIWEEDGLIDKRKFLISKLKECGGIFLIEQ